MPLLEDILLRFRRVWAPPGPVGGQTAVPEDLERRVEDELRELSSALAAIDAESQSLLQAAEAEAERIVTTARSEAERTIQSARSSLSEVRASSAAARIREGETDVGELTATAGKQAADLRSRARARMQGTVDDVLTDVFARPLDAMEEVHARVVGGG